MTEVTTKKQINTINSYINKGFVAKTQNKLQHAVNYFSQALKLKPDLQLETMLVFDISNMLKELGEYEKAETYLKNFLSAHAKNLSSACMMEAEANLKYVMFLHDLLDKAKTPKLPLSMVPTIIKISADNRLCEWKKQRYGI